MYIFERDILHSLYWSFYFEKKNKLFLHFLMVVMEARITKDYINLFIVSNLISLSGLKKFLCNKFRNEKILIYFIDNRYMYMHTLLQHMHTLDLLLNYNAAFWALQNYGLMLELLLWYHRDSQCWSFPI